MTKLNVLGLKILMIAHYELGQHGLRMVSLVDSGVPLDEERSFTTQSWCPFITTILTFSTTAPISKSLCDLNLKLHEAFDMISYSFSLKFQPVNQMINNVLSFTITTIAKVRGERMCKFSTGSINANYKRDYDGLD